MVGEIRTIGIIGAGQMGAGIAQVSANAGFKVILNDIALDNAQAALSKIDTATAKAVANDKMSTDERDMILANISPSGAIADLSDCDLVIEAASEVEHVKTAIFAELCPVLKPEALLASNTSSISITRLAATTDRPEQFMGIHFMNPVPRMKLVELVRGIATDETTFDAAKTYA